MTLPNFAPESRGEPEGELLIGGDARGRNAPQASAISLRVGVVRAKGLRMHTGEIETALAEWLAQGRTCVGQILVTIRPEGGFSLCHRDDAGRRDLRSDASPMDIVREDEAEVYRPLKTAPNLRRGWSVNTPDLGALRAALEVFYPGRLAASFLHLKGELKVTPLRETLGRQSGMYRVAARVTDAQAAELAGSVCRSDGGCLRTILWRLQAADDSPLTSLPPQKFDVSHDQTGEGAAVIPLLCQEACALFVEAARAEVKRSS